MKMKHLTAVLVMAFVITCVSASAAEQPSEEGAVQQSLYDQGLDLVSLVSEMASSDAYLSVYTTVDEVAYIAHSIREMDYSSPAAVFAVQMDVQGLIREMASGMIDQLSDKLADYLVKRTCTAIPSFLNGQLGSAQIAAASIITAGKTFMLEGLSDSMLYLYVFKNGYPVMVSFVPGEDGAVSASAFFVLDERYSATDPMEVENLLQEIGIQAVVSEISSVDGE